MDDANGVKQALYRFWAWSMQTTERYSPRTKDRIVKGITKAHVAYLRRRPPSAGSSMAAPTLLMTVRGRRTGTLRTMPAFYMPDGDRYVIVGSYGGDHRHPQWYHNLMAAGEAIIEIDGRKQDVSATRASPEERAALWPRLLEMWPSYADYQARQDSRELPVVIFTPRGASAT
ncbi:MAG TPA: nitroreductase/quinone reductase family protein [Pseudonocardia sp.]|jgi:deazaflavin-dependent oxidoreductase (nitroreductase family)|nr:nitroreductase/quinone reductase family protein [Pseudonocardia sp.]